MDNRELLENIRTVIEADKYYLKAYEDFFALNREIAKEEYEGNIKPTFPDNLWLRHRLTALVQENIDPEITVAAMDILKRTYLYMAQDDFESYMIYLEWERPPHERFYQPRMRVMKNVVKYLQMLADDELDELFLSMPPRVGKTTLMLFYVTWMIGRNPESSNLYCAFSDVITNAFYSGVLEVLKDPYTYAWHEIFPLATIASTNAKDETVNITRAKRYPSLTCRSLYGTLNGAVDVNGILIADDLIGGIEEALNKDRLISAWTKVDNNMLPRRKASCKTLWIGTRWSNSDPIGLQLNVLQSDMRFKGHRYKVITLPALNERGESNFVYDFDVGFDTAYYQKRKASFEKSGDEASWNAQYMGTPVERGGLLFESRDMRYFNGDLPEEEHLVRKFMAVDPAFGGGDYVAAPIAYQYDDGSIYIVDVVYSNADKKFTQPLLAQRIVKWEVKAVQFEANRSVAAYKEKVEEILHNNGYRPNLTTKPAPNNIAKEVRIFDKAPEIKEFYFLEGMKRSAEYEQFMQNVFAFQITGKNKHDDAPDSLAMLAEMVDGIGPNVRVGRRFF